MRVRVHRRVRRHARARASRARRRGHPVRLHRHRKRHHAWRRGDRAGAAHAQESAARSGCRRLHRQLVRCGLCLDLCHLRLVGLIGRSLRCCESGRLLRSRILRLLLLLLLLLLLMLLRALSDWPASRFERDLESLAADRMAVERFNGLTEAIRTSSGQKQQRTCEQTTLTVQHERDVR